jgi:serine/threonine-protein kinase HipA
MNNCLCCGKALNSNETEWHQSCIKKFFGTDKLPSIDLSNIASLFLKSKGKESVITGVQKKVSLHLYKERDSSRLTVIGYPSGYILKPQSDDFEQLPENEWLTMHLANICNIDTVPFGLLRLEDNSIAYITKRIDRKGKNKIAMEDFCQLGGTPTENKYKSSYEKVGKILSTYTDNIGLDYYKLFNIILFSFIVGNSDMHLKNFSLIKKNKNYILSPAYDLLNTLIITEDDEELALSIDGKKSNLNKKNLKYLAKRYSLNEIQIDRIFNNFEKKHDLILETINDSFLNEYMKMEYIKIIENRYSRLF